MLVGIDGGEVQIRNPAACSFLLDASEHTDKGGKFPVPFSVQALNVVKAFTSSMLSQVSPEPPAISHTFESKLESMSFDLLFEVLRASSFLDCDGLLSVACRVTSRVMCTLRTAPSLLGSVVGLGPMGDLVHDSILAVDEPILTPPSQPLTSSEDHPFYDEDVLALCLLECDVATLRVLKGLSPDWCHRARTTLCDRTWQTKQTVLDLDWALGSASLSLESKLWPCCASLCAALPNLSELTLLGIKVRARVHHAPLAHASLTACV